MVIDLVGELANMVLGGAKSTLENGGFFSRSRCQPSFWGVTI
ncbi:MAG: hypothetical protein WC236_03895 [Gallionellaceae bacterium]|jgi:hypothetical protein